jgi:MFS family permease
MAAVSLNPARQAAPRVMSPRWHVVDVFLPLAAGYFLSYLFRTVNGPISDRLMHDFGLNAGSLGLLTSIYFFAFTFAQLPYGSLVDRYGPRRIQSIVLAVGAIGAVLFATAQTTETLIVGRVLIGLGMSGALMAGLKAIALWMPLERRALANGAFIMCGGLGAMASTVPVTALLPVLGWRGIFLALAGATLASAVLVFVAVPEKPAGPSPEAWRTTLRGQLAVYRDPVFWRLAPLSASVVGTAFAVHGLWAARWLVDVDHFAPDRVIADLMVMGAGLTLGAGAIGLVTDRLRRVGVPPTTTFGAACLLFIGLQLALLFRLPVPAWLLWGAIASFGGMTVLSYSIMGEWFAPEKIGRANGALNVLHLSMAFVLQYGMGVVASHWRPDLLGHLPPVAYQVAFTVPLALELTALAWFGLSLGARQARGQTV